MQLIAFFLCEAINEMPDGRVNILGAGINGMSSPAIYPVDLEMVVFCRLAADATEIGEHTISFRLIDDDGQDILPELDGDFDVEEDTMVSNLIFHFSPLEVPGEGEYSFELVVDDEPIASQPFIAPPSEIEDIELDLDEV